MQIDGNDYTMLRTFLSGVIVDDASPVKCAMALATAIQEVMASSDQTDRLAVAGVLVTVARDVASDSREVKAN